MAQIPQQERRRRERMETPASHAFRAEAGGQDYRCRIVNVSVGGLKLRFEGPAPTGPVINLFPPLSDPVAGICVWTEGEELGLELLLPEREPERTLRTLSLVL